METIMITADLVIKNASELLTIKGASNKPKVKEQLSNLVFAGSREKEWVDRINGKDYLEILKNGGGILSTVNATRNAGEEELLNRALHHLGNMLNHGTTTIEAKSGYGLTIDSEIKILRLLKKLAKKQPIEIVSTFLGAHAVPPEFANSAVYAKFIIEKMIPVVAKLADYCDVFCEKSAFSAEETKRILLAGKKYGLRPRAHINEFNEIGGTEIAKEVKAIAVDHLDVVSDDGIKNIREAGSITNNLLLLFYPLSQFQFHL